MGGPYNWDCSILGLIDLDVYSSACQHGYSPKRAAALWFSKGTVSLLHWARLSNRDI